MSDSATETPFARVAAQIAADHDQRTEVADLRDATG